MADWRKSSFSKSGNCLEAAPEWRKASFSTSGNCAEAAAAGAGILVRDTKDRDGVVLWFPAGAWRAFGESLVRGSRSIEQAGRGEG